MKINKSIAGTLVGILLSGIVTAVALLTVNSFRKSKNKSNKDVKEV